MPLTNENVIQAHEALVALVKNDKEDRFSIPKNVRMILAENLNSTFPVMTSYTSQHNALVAKNGKQNAQGQWEIPAGSDGAKVFAIEKQDLLNSPSGVESFQTFNYSDMPEGLGIDLLALMLRTGMLVK